MHYLQQSSSSYNYQLVHFCNFYPFFLLKSLIRIDILSNRVQQNGRLFYKFQVVQEIRGC